jgi:hypothetical protein
MKSELKEFEIFNDTEEYLRYTWIAFTTHLDKKRALWYAHNGQQFLDNQEIEFDDQNDLLDKVHRKGLGYHMIAMAYVWNNWFDEAFQLENNFMNRMYWHSFSEGIGQYLEMLIIKQQTDHLKTLFNDIEFKYAFLTHFEVFVSLLINPEYTITKMNEFVPLVNKVNGLNKTYGDEHKFI